MDYSEEYLIYSTDINILESRKYTDYVIHMVCNKGQCEFLYREELVTLQAGNGMIVITNVLLEPKPTKDFEVRMVLTRMDFHLMATPQSNYGIQGSLDLFIHPVIPLLPEEHRLLNEDMDQIVYRLENTRNFRQDVLQCATKMLFLDYFQPHARKTSDQKITSNTADTMFRFIQLLNEEQYKVHRDVKWYASELCIAPKYLSEISNKCSGQSAMYWITRFTTTHIHRLLKDRLVPLTEISDTFHFSSLAHFSRYVQQNLGKSPSEFRS